MSPTIADGTTWAASGGLRAGRRVAMRAVPVCGLGNAKGRAVAGGINATAAGTTGTSNAKD